MIRNLINTIFIGPSFSSDEETLKSRFIYLYTGIIGVFLLIAFLVTITSSILAQSSINFFILSIYLIVFLILYFARYIVNQQGFNISIWTLIILTISAILARGILSGGFRDFSRIVFLLPIIIASFTLGTRDTIITSFITILAGFLIFYLEVTNQISSNLPSIPNVVEFNYYAIIIIFISSILFFFNDFIKRVTTKRNLALNEAQSYSEQLALSFTELENARTEFAEQNEVLQKKTQYLEATTEISLLTSTNLDINEIINNSVNIIGNLLDFYHVGLFLINENKDWAILKAVSSDGGKKMLARNHRLRVGAEGIVGFVTSTGQPRIVQATMIDEIHAKTAELPDTKAEMAVPLKDISGNIIGALDIQGTTENAFSDDDIESLETISRQISIAISNATLVDQLQKQYIETQKAYGNYTFETWRNFIESKNKTYSYNNIVGISVENQPSANIVQNYGTSFSIPIQSQNTTFGYLDVDLGIEYNLLDEETKIIIQKISEEIGYNLENALLYYDTTTQVANEQLSSYLTTKIRENLNIRDILKNTVEELKTKLQYSDVSIKFLTDSDKTME